VFDWDESEHEIYQATPMNVLVRELKELCRKNRKATTLLGRAKFRSRVNDWSSRFNRG